MMTTTMATETMGRGGVAAAARSREVAEGFFGAAGTGRACFFFVPAFKFELPLGAEKADLAKEAQDGATARRGGRAGRRGMVWGTSCIAPDEEVIARGGWAGVCRACGAGAWRASDSLGG